MITSLCEEVQKLKCKLDVRDDEELYKDSMIASVEEERDVYKCQLEFERQRGAEKSVTGM